MLKIKFEIGQCYFILIKNLEVIMKLFLTVAFLSSTFMAFAADDTKFAEHKKMMLENMTQKITALQSVKSCVESATNHEAIKKCHEMAKAERTKIESQQIDRNIKNLEDKKKELQEKQQK
jgi:predicted RecB family endonuclease